MLPFAHHLGAGDEIFFRSVLSSQDARQLRDLVEGYDLLFIDEAQRMPEIGLNLKIIADQMNHIHVMVTVSSSLDLASKVREPLTGRTWTFTLHPIAQYWRRKEGGNDGYPVILVLAVVAFELLVWYAAADSTDSFDSPEWERRRTWRRGV